MDKTDLLNAVVESLREDADLTNIKIEVVIQELNVISDKISSLHAKMEEIDLKYSEIINNFQQQQTFTETPLSVDYEAPRTETKVSKYYIDEYTKNIASRILYIECCLDPATYLDKYNAGDTWDIEEDIHFDRKEGYLNRLNEILDTRILNEEMVNYISDTITDLIEYTPIEFKLPNVSEDNVAESLGSAAISEIPNDEVIEETSNNVSVVIEESVNPATDEITTHYKKLESGIFFADWVTSQKFDYRIKNALASIDYIIDEVARKPDVDIIVDEDNILGIQSKGSVNFYKDKNDGNKISAFLVGVKELMDNDINKSAIISCYDEVRNVEREQDKSKKRDFR